MFYTKAVRLMFAVVSLVAAFALTGCGRDSFVPAPAPIGGSQTAVTKLAFSAPVYNVLWRNDVTAIPNLTAPAGCGPQNVMISIVTNDSANYTFNPLASWKQDQTNATYGWIARGSAFSPNGFNTYTMTATGTGTCQNQTATAQVHIENPPPTIDALVKPVVTKVQYDPITITSTPGSFVNQNFNFNNSAYIYFGGTTFEFDQSPCNSTVVNPSTTAGGYGQWIDARTMIISSAEYPGIYSLHLNNAPSIDGTGGGSACQSNYLWSTAPISEYAAKNGIIAYADPYGGSLILWKDGGKTLIGQFDIGADFRSPIVTDDAVYAASPENRAIAKVDLSTMAISFISTPNFVPMYLTEVKTSSNQSQIFVLANQGYGNGGYTLYSGSLLQLVGGSFQVVASADGFNSIETVGDKVFWTASTYDRTSFWIGAYSTTTQQLSALNPLPAYADTLVAVPSGGALAYHIGDSTAFYLDATGLPNSQTVSFPLGLLVPNRGLVTLQNEPTQAAVAMTDGTIAAVDVKLSSSGTPTGTSTLILGGTVPEQYLGGFSVEGLSNGITEVSFVDKGSGSTEPKVISVPTKQN
jgi:hypothetical protein